MGLVGPNGAGKSTILRIIKGLQKRDIGFIADDMRLYESETIEFHMKFIKSISDSWDQEYATSLLKRFDLIKDQKIKGLSHGQRVKTTLMLALARRPKLLVFDEPTTGLAPAVRNEVLDEMMDSLQDETRSILFSSHNTLDVEQISDYITFIYDGRIIESQDKETFLDSWRRLRLINTDNKPLPKLSNIRGIQQSGSLCAVTVKHYDDSIAD